jgi:4-hydroxybenzoate polyprenyltransferase
MKNKLFYWKYKLILFYLAHEAEIVCSLQAIAFAVLIVIFGDASILTAAALAVFVIALEWCLAPIIKKQEKKRRIQEYLKEAESEKTE